MVDLAAGPPFAPFEPADDALAASADRVDRHAGDVEALTGTVDAAHAPARDGVAGLLSDPMAAVTEPARHAAMTVLQGSLVVGAAVRRFGMEVARYNSGVAELNAEWEAAAADDFGAERWDLPSGAVPEDQAASAAAFREEREALAAALRRDLQTRQQQLEEALDTGADEVAAALAPGPASDTVLIDLYDAGALSAAMTPAFPGVDYAAQGDPAERWDNLVTGGQIPDELWDMSAEEIRDYLLLNPAIAATVAPAFGLLLEMGPDEQHQVFLDALGRYEAHPVATAVVASTPGQDSLGTIEQGTTRLREINDRLAAGGRLTDAERAYLHGWYDGMGADALAALPGHVEEATGDVPLGVPQADEDEYIARQRSRYLGPVADGIMYLSHPDPDPDADVTDDLAAMPQAVRDLATTPVGLRDELDRVSGRFAAVTADQQEVAVPGVARFAGFADLLDASTVQGGDTFTFQLGQQAIRVEQQLNEVLFNATHDGTQIDPPFFTRDGDQYEGGVGLRPYLYLEDGQEYSYGDPYAPEDAVTVAEARAQLDTLLGQGHDGVSTMLSVVARNDDASSQMLTDDDVRHALLLTPRDDATAAASVVRSGTERDLAGGEDELQAEAALAVIEDVARNRLFYVERSGETPRMPEEMARAVADVGYRYLDAFARPDEVAESGVAADLLIPGAQGRYRGLLLTDGDQEGFLQFVVGTGGAVADDFWANATAQLHHTVGQAMATGDAGEVNNAMTWAGTFQGEYENASHRYHELQFDEEEARYREAEAASRQQALLIKLVSGGAISGLSFGSAGAADTLVNLVAAPRWAYTTIVPLAGSVALSGLNQAVDQWTAPSMAPMDEAGAALADAGAAQDQTNRVSSQMRDYLLLAAAAESGFDPLDLRGADPQSGVVQALYETADDGTPTRDPDGNLRLRPYEDVFTEANAGNVGAYLTDAWADTAHAWTAQVERSNAASPTERSASLMPAEYYDAARENTNDRRGPQPYTTRDDAWVEHYDDYAWGFDGGDDRSRLSELWYGPHDD